MKTKNIDCLELKSKVQEILWKEAGEKLEGLVEILEKSKETNPLLKLLKDKKDKSYQFKNIEIISYTNPAK